MLPIENILMESIRGISCCRTEEGPPKSNGVLRVVATDEHRPFAPIISGQALERGEM
jgi:hypothetical protein